MSTLARCLVVTWCLLAPLVASARFAWQASETAVTRIDLETGAITSLALQSPVDELHPQDDGAAWVRSGRDLLRIDDAMLIATRIVLDSPPRAGRSLNWDEASRRLWVVDDRSVLVFDALGVRLAAHTLDHGAYSIAYMGPDAILILTDVGLLQIDETGVPRGLLPLAPPAAQDLTFGLLPDLARLRVWIATRAGMRDVNPVNMTFGGLAVSVPRFTGAIAISPVDGSVHLNDGWEWSSPSLDGQPSRGSPSNKDLILRFGPDRSGASVPTQVGVSVPLELPLVRATRERPWAVHAEPMVEIVPSAMRIEPAPSGDWLLRADLVAYCDGQPCLGSTALVDSARLQLTLNDAGSHATIGPLSQGTEQRHVPLDWPPIPGSTSLEAMLETVDALGNVSGATLLTIEVDPDGNPRLATPVQKASPTVAITAPINNATFVAPATINIAATASDSDGTVSKVEFYSGSTLLGSDTTSPYTRAWSSVPIGTYTLTAKAFDNTGATTVSAPISVQVKANVAPTVSLTAPANNASFTAPATVALAAIASDSDGTVTKVEFFRGTTKIATDTTAPYSFSWTNVAGGSYALTAKATDDKGAVKSSSVVNITVNAPPTVSLTAPANGATFAAPANITLTASASDAGGSITKVEFYSGSTRLATDTASPFSFAWNNVAVGTYTLTAKAFDNLGATTTSAPRSITVNPNQSPAVTLTSPTANATFVAPASVPLGATATDTDGTVSKVEFFRGGSTLIGSDTSSPYALSWNNVAAGAYVLSARATDNKGAIANSATVSITVLPNQPPTITLDSDPPGPLVLTSTPTPIRLIAAPADADGIVNRVRFFVSEDYGSTWLLVGTSTTAPWEASWTPPAFTELLSLSFYAEARDNGGSIVDSEVKSVTLVQPRPPTANFLEPAEPLTFEEPATVVLVAGAQDPDRVDFPDQGVASVSFMANGSTIASMTAPNGSGGEYAYVWRSVPIGTYSVLARATDVSGATADSYPVTVKVVARPTAPTVLLTQPANGASLLSSPSITVAAAVSGGSRPISRVDFITAMGTLAGSASVPPYSVTWSGAPAGVHGIAAHVVDVDGVITVSPSVYFQVRSTVAYPEVVLTAPQALNTYAAGTAITLRADVLSLDSPVTAVDFYRGGTKIGTSTAAPWEYVWSSPASGTATLTARATNAAARITISSPITVQFASNNAPPLISLTAPAAGSTYSAPASINLAATASDPGGSVTKVEFFAGNTLVATRTTPPYSATWSSVPVGDYTLLAKATDNQGAVSSTSPVAIRVDGAPSVTIVTPTTGSAFGAGSIVTIEARASVPGHPVARVEFLSGTAIIGNVSFSGSSTLVNATFAWSTAPPGEHTLTARAVSADGLVTISAPVTVRLTDLAVRLVSPLPWERFRAPAIVPLLAYPSTSGAPIARVDFMADGAVIGTRSGPPFEVDWTNPPIGSHTVEARVYDSAGASASTPVISVTIDPEIVDPDAQLEITTSDGATINDTFATISGQFAASANAGVVINGRLAALGPDGTFFLDGLPLTHGANTIEIIATDQNGQRLTRTITLTSTASAPFEVTLTPQEALAPAEATLTIRRVSPVAFSRITIDTDGDGAPNATATSLDQDRVEYTIPYSAPGLYEVAVRAYDLSESLIYTGIRRIRVVDPLNMAYVAVLPFRTMVSRLRANDPTKALDSFTGIARGKYAAIFSDLAASVASIANQLGEIGDVVLLSHRAAEITVTRQTGDGPKVFLVYVIRGEDGVWRIEDM